MIDEMASVIIKKASEKYPHIANPTVMKAKITSIKKTSKEYKLHYRLKDVSSGEEKDYEATCNYYLYGIQVIDSQGTVLSSYPAIPNVESRVEYEIGNTVVVAFTGEGFDAVIVGG